MSVSIEVKVNESDLRRVMKRLRKVSEPSQFQSIMEQAVRKGLKHVRKSVTESIERRVYARQSPFPNKPRTNRLKRDFRTFPKVAGDEVLGIVESNVPYAVAHEQGALIRPKTAKAMTIPISPISIGRRASEFQNKFARNNVLFGVFGARGVVPLYILKKQVQIKKKQPFELGVREAIPRYVQEMRETIEEKV